MKWQIWKLGSTASSMSLSTLLALHLNTWANVEESHKTLVLLLPSSHPPESWVKNPSLTCVLLCMLLLLMLELNIEQMCFGLEMFFLCPLLVSRRRRGKRKPTKNVTIYFPHQRGKLYWEMEKYLFKPFTRGSTVLIGSIVIKDQVIENLKR